MILMPQIFDVTANENAHYKCNELEYRLSLSLLHVLSFSLQVFCSEAGHLSLEKLSLTCSLLRSKEDICIGIYIHVL